MGTSWRSMGSTGLWASAAGSEDSTSSQGTANPHAARRSQKNEQIESER